MCGIQSGYFGYKFLYQPTSLKEIKGSRWGTPPFNRIAWRWKGYEALLYSN